MTRDKARKHANHATQAATGRRYTDAARLNNNPAYQRASDIARAAHEADLTSTPANITEISDLSFVLTVAGTVLVIVEGNDARESVLLERLLDNDTPKAFPELLPRRDKDNPALPSVMEGIRDWMSLRHRDRVAHDNRCAHCGDLYRPKNLLPTQAGAAAPQVCPACWLSTAGEHQRDVATAAVQLDRRMQADLSINSGWAGPIALLNVAAASVATTLNKLEPTLLEDESAEFWRTPGDLWQWLPPVNNRLAVLPDRGTGACLAAVLRHLDKRGITLQGVAEGAGVRDVDERLWPAVVAYATSFATLTHDESRQLLPVPVDQTFDRLTFNPDTIGSVLTGFPGTTLDPQTAATTLALSERVAREMFSWPALVARTDR